MQLIIGLGKTGRSIAAYLQRRAIPFAVYDTRSEIDGLDLFRETFPEVQVFQKTLPQSIEHMLTGCIASPGVALEAPALEVIRRLQLPLWGDIECLAQEIKKPVIAITGTNGKSTVTTLVGEMAKKAGLTVAVAGNIGTPVLDLLDDGQAYDAWVLELSSFQLDLVQSLAPAAATVLNISADHLDRHHDFKAYVQAKQRVYHSAKTRVYNRDDALTYPATEGAAMTSFGLTEPSLGQWGISRVEGQEYLMRGKEKILAVNDLQLKGRQNWQNALAACALAQTLDIDKESMVAVLKTFPGLPHRCQWVRELDEVTWINDSKGTNVGAAIAAIAGIGESSPGKVILIAGGVGKGADFTELRAIVAKYVRSIVLIGEDAQKIEQALSGTATMVQAKSFEEAIVTARRLALPADVVLLSPACASFDMFRDFNHRGEVFTQLVQSL